MKEKFWVSGRHTINSILQYKKRRIYKVISSDEKITKSIKGCELVHKSFFNKIFKDEDLVHQNIAAQIDLVEEKLIDHLNNIKNILILDNVTDPRNIGSIFRSALAFNVDGVILKKGSYKDTSALMFKAASGATERLKIFNEVNISRAINLLKKNGFWIYGLDVGAKNIINKNTTFSKKNAFVFGSEEKGISHLIKNNCDELLKINISNIDSLNISNAVAASLAILTLK